MISFLNGCVKSYGLFFIFLFSNHVNSHSPPEFLYAHSNLMWDAEIDYCSARGFTHGNSWTDNFYGGFRSAIYAYTQEDVESCGRPNSGRYCELFTLGNGATIICVSRNNTCPVGSVGYYPNCISAAGGNGQNIGSGTPLTCNPINISTGNKFFQYTDYQDNGFSFFRSYNSLTGAWRFSYKQRLIIYNNLDNEFVVAEGVDGKSLRFVNSNGDLIPPSQRREQLSFDGTYYTLTFPDNTVETYDTQGRLLSILSPNESSSVISYAGNTTTVTKEGEQLQLTLGAENEVIQAAFPNGDTITYDYQMVSNRPLLFSLSHSAGTTNQFFYEDSRFPTYITGIEDENGSRISSVVYDNQGRAISSEKGPLGSGIERTQIQYNSDGTRTVTNALGKQNTYHFTQFNGEYKITQVEGHPSANCAAANKAYTYDANGFMASKTDWQGNITTYIHNDRGQELSRTEASGTPQARTITTEWHTEFNLPTRIIEPESEITMSYGENGRLLNREVRELQ